MAELGTAIYFCCKSYFLISLSTNSILPAEFICMASFVRIYVWANFVTLSMLIHKWSGKYDSEKKERKKN